MKAVGALAGVAAIGGWSPARAQAGGRVVVGTWGGDYSKLLSKNIDTPLMVPKKYEVVHDIGGDPERRANPGKVVPVHSCREWQMAPSARPNTSGET